METLTQHLQNRGINFKTTKVSINETEQLAYFFLYNLTGQITGYQRYNPNGIRGNNKNSDKSQWKYYTFIGNEGSNKYPQIYGLETYQHKYPYLFITEGIFDVIKIHNLDLPGIALLGNAPSPQIISWINTLFQKTIVICDNDEASKDLHCLGDYIFNVPEPYKDLGEIPQKEVEIFINNILGILDSKKF